MILIVDCGSKKTPLIEEMVYEFDDTLVVSLLDLSAESLKQASGVIISGAPILITEVDVSPYMEKVSWLKETTIPVLGICFGHQLLGLTFGAHANRQREDRDWQIVEIIHDCALFDRMPIEIEFMEDHCEAISIPPDFIHIGVSDATVNEAMMHKSLPLFGVQFHPEVSGNMGAILFENFVNICQQHATKAAL